MTLDEDRGVDCSAEDIAALVRIGMKVEVASELLARAVLFRFGMTTAQIDSAIRFSHTGQV